MMFRKLSSKFTFSAISLVRSHSFHPHSKIVIGIQQKNCGGPWSGKKRRSSAVSGLEVR